MGRYFLCALAVLLIGCSSSGSDNSTSKGQAASSSTNAPERPGPPEAELPAILDLPLYPGAKIVSNTVGDMDGDNRYHLLLETSDPAQKVGDFYSENGLKTEVRGKLGQFMGLTKKGNNVLMSIVEEGGKTTINIRVSPAI